MVTKEELAAKTFEAVDVSKMASRYVTVGEMKRFEQNGCLNDVVYHVITRYAEQHGIKPKYEGISDRCQLSSTSLKKSCTGTQRITRHFLYKLAVGLHLSVDEANALFELCGGSLSEQNIEDYICKKALLDGDDIFLFIDQFNYYTQQYDRLQKKDKLKRLEDE